MNVGSGDDPVNREVHDTSAPGQAASSEQYPPDIFFPNTPKPFFSLGTLGWLLLISGMIAAVLALLLPTTIGADDTYAATARLSASITGAVPPPLPDTFNLGMLQRQILLFTGGLAAVVVGVVVIVGSHLARLISATNSNR